MGWDDVVHRKVKLLRLPSAALEDRKEEITNLEIR